MNRPKTFLFWLVPALVALAALPTLAPIFPPAVRDVIMQMFSPVCHQLPDRSPHTAGIQWAICHRDAGLYWGLPLGALLYGAFRSVPGWLGRRMPLVFAAALFPMGLDWGMDAVGWVTNSPFTRILTGAIFGVTAGYLLAFAIGDDTLSSDNQAHTRHA